MKPIWTICLALCLVPLAVAESPEKPLSPFDQALVTQEKSALTAMQKNDAPTLQRTLTDDFVQAGVDGSLHSRQEVLGYMQYLGVQEFLPYNFKVLPITADVAIVSYNLVIRTNHIDEDFSLPRYQHFSSVWVKQGEQWRLKFQQATAAMSE